MTTYRRANRLLRAPIADEEVLLSMKTQEYHLIGGSGQEWLALLEEGNSVDEAAAKISQRTGIPIGDLLTDGQLFVEALVKRGLLEEAQ